MPAFENVKAGYQKLWLGMTINPAKLESANQTARRCLAGEARYKDVERRTGVPWFFIALCHLREGNLRWDTYLGNGQSIHKRTTIVPEDRGPFSTFEVGAVDALTNMKFTGKPKSYWTIERIMYHLEGFNGYGYRGKGVNSPYLWGGSNRYTKGKYTRDHFFDPNFVDQQLGSMVVLSRMCALNAEVNAAVNPPVESAVRAPGKDVVTGGAVAAVTTAAVAAKQGWSWADIGIAGLEIGGALLALYCALLLYRRFMEPNALPDDHPARSPA